MAISKAELKDIKSLSTKKGRKARKQFIAEGVRLLEEAARHKVKPELVCYCDTLLSERGERLVTVFGASGAHTVPVSARQLDSISETRTSQGVLAVFPVWIRSLEELCRLKSRRVLVCENISDPGNLGTLLRSALAFGFGPVLLVGRCVDVYSGKVVRSSAGAVFGLETAALAYPQLWSFLATGPYRLIGTAGRGKGTLTDLHDLAGRRRLAAAVGSEAEGLSEAIGERCDRLVRIDHHRSVESLNAAVAGSIVMKQIYDFS